MLLNLDVLFPGGKRVDVQVGDMLIRTDQSAKYGGDGSAPEPFSLFLASIAACAGIYALSFCQSRNIDTKGLELSVACSHDEKSRLCRTLIFSLTLPPDFPEKYRAAIIRAMDQCTVKRNLFDPPEIKIELNEDKA